MHIVFLLVSSGAHPVREDVSDKEWERGAKYSFRGMLVVVGEKGHGMQRESESDVLQRGATKSKQELYSCWSNRRAGPHPHSIVFHPLVIVDVQSINVEKRIRFVWQVCVLCPHFFILSNKKTEFCLPYPGIILGKSLYSISWDQTERQTTSVGTCPWIVE